MLSQNIKKLKGDPLAKKNGKKSHNAKKLRGETFSLSGYCVMRKKEKSFLFSSLGQIIQFGTIKSL